MASQKELTSNNQQLLSYLQNEENLKQLIEEIRDSNNTDIREKIFTKLYPFFFQELSSSYRELVELRAIFLLKASTTIVANWSGHDIKDFFDKINDQALLGALTKQHGFDYIMYRAFHLDCPEAVEKFVRLCNANPALTEEKQCLMKAIADAVVNEYSQMAPEWAINNIGLEPLLASIKQHSETLVKTRVNQKGETETLLLSPPKLQDSYNRIEPFIRRVLLSGGISLDKVQGTESGKLETVRAYRENPLLWLSQNNTPLSNAQLINILKTCPPNAKQLQNVISNQAKYLADKELVSKLIGYVLGPTSKLTFEQQQATLQLINTKLVDGGKQFFIFSKPPKLSLESEVNPNDLLRNPVLAIISHHGTAENLTDALKTPTTAKKLEETLQFLVTTHTDTGEVNKQTYLDVIMASEKAVSLLTEDKTYLWGLIVRPSTIGPKIIEQACANGSSLSLDEKVKLLPIFEKLSERSLSKINYQQLFEVIKHAEETTDLPASNLIRYLDKLQNLAKNNHSLSSEISNTITDLRKIDAVEQIIRTAEMQKAAGNDITFQSIIHESRLLKEFKDLKLQIMRHDSKIATNVQNPAELDMQKIKEMVSASIDQAKERLDQAKMPGDGKRISSPSKDELQI